MNALSIRKSGAVMKITSWIALRMEKLSLLNTMEKMAFAFILNADLFRKHIPEPV